MDGASNSSSSKVTVEYHDPAGVFPLLSAQLQARLPLRNLHWKSPSRPLRSIDSLHVELVPGQNEGDPNARPATAASQESLHSQDTQRNSQALDGHGLQPFRPLQKERRHQIPGLRRTPYLKVYLFRCDDSETYKTTARKQIRDWIRENTPASHHSSSSNSQEHHDAYEWLILHVVVPNTSAAAQPRFSGSTKSSTGTAKDRSTSTRWPGGKSTTIFEKIRSDFNSSSSSAPDRVAQVRIQSSELPPSLQFSGSGVTIPAFQETPQERNNAWSDLVTKFKTLILLSFNWRVSQYEEDIREKDAQRSLPGWNFCTFFVLKEGLAHSFEGVGLVEDALVIYDELSLGLDTVISDKANGASQTDATTFLDYTEEFKQYLHDMLSSNEPNSKLQQMMKKPIGEGNKNYRGLILASNISIFDFKCYLFARQVLLLLRLSRRGFDLGQISRKSQETRRLSLDGAADQRRSLEMPGEVNLGALADICQRALSFATSTSRVMREELRAADEGNKLNADTLDNFIASWTAAIVDQTLAETTSTTLSAGQNNRGPPSPLKTPRTRTTGGDHLSAGDSKSHPGRSNSLSNRPVSLVEPSTAQLSDWPKSPSGDTTRQGDQPVRFGLVELAGHRAELYLLERRILEKLGSKRQWHVGWAAVENTPPRRPNGFHEVNLDAPDSSLRENGAEEHTDSERRLNRGLCHAKLSQAISLEDFRRTYEAWSDDAIRLYRIAGQSRASERILGELAIVKYDSGDLAGAASCFSRVIPLYTEGSWNHVEVAMLRMHAHCLKALHRKDEYVRLLLTILSKAATRTKSTAKRFSKRLSSPGMQNALDTSLSWLDDDDVHARGIMTELVEYSEELPYDISVPMETYFSDIAVEPHVVHYEDRDGYKILLRFRHLLDDDLNLDSLSLKLVGTTAEQKRDIILASEGTMEVEKGMAKCWLHTNVTTFGSFVVEQISLKAKKIVFIHEPLSKTEASMPFASPPFAPLETAEAAKRIPVFCFPRSESLDAKIHLSRSIHIDKTRSIEIHCSTGWNDTDSLEFRLRAASAGLRLHTSDASIIEGNVDITKPDKARPGVVALAHTLSNSDFKLRVPFEIETHTSDILIRIDAEYTTRNGVFQYFSHAKMPIDLPLDVNVQDSFKPFALFSTFNIRTSNQKPLRLLSAELGDSSLLSVQGPMGGPWPRIVSPQKALSLQYTIKRKGTDQEREKNSLPLYLVYQRIDEQVEAVATTSFTKDLSDSDFEHLRRLLVPSFAEKLTQNIESEDYAQVAYRDEFLIPAFEDFGWEEILQALPSSARDNLQQWLEQWHKDHSKFLLGNINKWTDLQKLHGYSDSLEPVDTSNITRQITISVSIPTIHVIPTASLAIQTYRREYLPTDTAWPIGEAKSATLTISHSRMWCDLDELKDVASIESGDAPIQFLYEVDANPDLWLVGGPKRGTFWQREGDDEKMTVGLLLVPLRKGDWAYPGVDVRPVQPARPQKSENQSRVQEHDGEEKEITCECYYEDAFQRVLVVPDVRGTTVGLMSRGGTTLLETVGRDESLEV